MDRRLFLAINSTQAISHAVHEYCQTLDVSHVRWIPVSNWHITLQFLGNIQEDAIEDLIASCAFAFEHGHEMILPFRHIAFAPPNDFSRMIWAIFDCTQAYKNLVDATVQATRPFVDRRTGDTKDLIPHITLARLSRPQECMQLQSQPIVPDLLIQEIILMESKLNHNGSIYTPLYTFSLLKE